MFGDFKIIIDSTNGFVNATKLCASGGRRFKKWLENDRSKRYIDFVKRIHSTGNGEDFRIMYECKGGPDKTSNLLKGTYVHEDLVVSIACWVSDEFAYKVNLIIRSVLVKEIIDKHAKEIMAMETKMIKLENDVEKYKAFEEDISPKTLDESKRNVFILTKINDSFPYHATRCQKRSKPLQLKQLKQKHADAKVVYERTYNPNAINFFNRVKEQIQNIVVYRNKIKLINGYNEEAFINDMKKILQL